jgi:hypothetical protein
MKILILTVGSSDAPLVHAIEQVTPDFVFFLCSTGGGPGASDRTITQRVETGTRAAHCPRCERDYQVTSHAGPVAVTVGLAPERFQVESVLAHGLAPVDRDEWRRSGEAWRAWIEEAAGDLVAPPAGVP